MALRANAHVERTFIRTLGFNTVFFTSKQIFIYRFVECLSEIFHAGSRKHHQPFDVFDPTNQQLIIH